LDPWSAIAVGTVDSITVNTVVLAKVAGAITVYAAVTVITVTLVILLIVCPTAYLVGTLISAAGAIRRTYVLIDVVPAKIGAIGDAQFVVNISCCDLSGR
jgi:hypothetical protein